MGPAMYCPKSMTRVPFNTPAIAFSFGRGHSSDSPFIIKFKKNLFY